MPKWFGVLFLLTLLSAALSTLSSQFHTMGTAFGRDIYEQGVRRKVIADKWTRLVTQLGIMIAIVVTVTLCWKYSKSLAGVIAKSTALFFALCASSFLPSLFLGLFWRRMTRAAAIASMVSAFFFAAFWLVFVQADTSKAVGLLAWLKARRRQGPSRVGFFPDSHRTPGPQSTRLSSPCRCPSSSPSWSPLSPGPCRQSTYVSVSPAGARSPAVGGGILGQSGDKDEKSRDSDVHPRGPAYGRLRVGPGGRGAAR